MIRDNFAYFFITTYVEGAHYNCHGKAILMSIRNIGLYESLTITSFNYHQICTLSLLLQSDQ